MMNPLQNLIFGYKKSKRGNAFFDSLTIVIVLVVMGFIAMIGLNVLTEFNDDAQTSDLNNMTKEKLDTLTTNYPSFMDYAFLTALILLWIVAIVASFLIDSHPVFFIITILLIGFVLLLAGVLSNAFGELSSEADLDSSSFPITNWVIQNLVLIVLFVGLSVGIALYGKTRLNSGGSL